MLQVFHQAQAVPTRRASAGGRSRAGRRRRAEWRGHKQATVGRVGHGEQQGGHACSDVRP
jgi:hypothetical protein